MLEVVNAEVGSFAKGDGAEMRSDFKLASVRSIDRGLQFLARDVHVALEGRGALVRPELDGRARVGGVLDLVHLRRERAHAFEIRAGDVHLGAKHLSGIDQLLRLDVGIGFHRSGCADRGHAAGEIELGEAAAVFGIERHVGAGGRVIHMVMHADNAGERRIARKVDTLGVVGDVDAGRRADRDDLARVNDDRLIFDGGRAVAIDHTDVFKREVRLGMSDVRLERGRLREK